MGGRTGTLETPTSLVSTRVPIGQPRHSASDKVPNFCLSFRLPSLFKLCRQALVIGVVAAVA
jgi:hypothetical protein